MVDNVAKHMMSVYWMKYRPHYYVSMKWWVVTNGKSVDKPTAEFICDLLYEKAFVL